MEKKIYVCENCKKVAESQKELRKQNWLQISGDITHGINIWLDKPRKHKEGVSDSFMITIGYQNRDYHFCSIKCLKKLLNGNESI
jgi:hypothetical protein